VKPGNKLARNAKWQTVELWTEAFIRYYEEGHMQDLPMRKQRGLMEDCIEEDMLLELRGAFARGLPPWDPDDEANSMIGIIKKRFLQKRPLQLRRTEYLGIHQKPNEDHDEFNRRVRVAHSHAEFDQTTPEDVMVVLAIRGNADEKLRTKYLDDPQRPLTMDRVEEIALQFMTTQEAAKGVSRSLTEATVALAQATDTRPGARTMADFRRQYRGRCWKCGRDLHAEGEACKAKGVTCHKCGKTDHFANMCIGDVIKSPEDRSRPPSRGPSRGSSRQPSRERSKSREARVRAVNVAVYRSEDSRLTDTPRITVAFLTDEGSRFVCDDVVPDTGATRTILSEALIREHNVKVYDDEEITIFDAQGKPMNYVGSVDLDLESQGSPKIRVKALVTNGLREGALLSWTDMQKMGIISEDFPAPQESVRVVTSEPARAKDADPQTKYDASEGPSRANDADPQAKYGTNEGSAPTTESKYEKKPESGSCSEGSAPATESPQPDSKGGVLSQSDREYLDSIEKIMADYEDVLVDDMGNTSGTLKGDPMKIEFKKGIDIKPKRISVARPVPLHYEKRARALVNELLKAGVIRRVTEPTDWISPAMFVEKSGGALRLVTDYKSLNEFIQRPIHLFPSAEQIMKNIKPTSKIYCKLDAINSYYQVRLDSPSQLLTCFLLPWGRFCYTVAPMGLAPSSDEFCRRSDEVILGLDYAQKIVDDVLLESHDLPSLLRRIRCVLTRAREHGLRISRKKLEIGENIKFAGYMIGPNGVSPDPDKIKAIREFPTPKSVTDVRSFLGLANQLGSFMPDLAQITVEMRKLLKKGVGFNWLEDHQNAFERAKKILCSEMLIKTFDPQLPTEILTDASRLFGMGFALIQREQGSNAIRLITCGSCSLTPTQQNYSTTELEMLAVCYGIAKCSFYLKGIHHYVVVTDHKPLIGCFAKDLNDIENKRLQRMRERLISYNFTVIWQEGKSHLIADALSRAPVFPGEPEEEEQVQANVVMCRRVSEDPALQAIFDAAEECDEYKNAIQAFNEGQPPPHWIGKLWTEISLFQDTLLVRDDNRIVVPRPVRPEITRRLHAPHTGLNKTLANAKQLYWWPGMRNEITQYVQSCEVCQCMQASQQKEPMAEEDVGRWPMDQVGIDLFKVGRDDYIVMIDRFSGYPWTAQLKGVDTKHVTDALDNWFLEVGYAQTAISDGGPQFRGPFDEYCKEKSIKHVTTSPYFSSANGLAESGVKNMKRLIQKCSRENQNFRQALLEWRNTPNDTGYSPAQAFFGRRQRGILPAITQAESIMAEFREARLAQKAARKETYDKRALALPILRVGQRVRVQNPATGEWPATGEVQEMCESGRSYIVLIEDGPLVRRNRRMLRPVPGATASEPTENDEAAESEAEPDTSMQGEEPTSDVEEPTEHIPLRRSERQKPWEEESTSNLRRSGRSKLRVTFADQ